MELTVKGLSKFDQDLQNILEGNHDKLRELHEDLADMLEDTVRAAIDQSGMKDGGGKIKRYQVKYVGSRGGYAAVRPDDSQSGPNGPGAITRYLEQGHRIPRARGGKGYRPRIKRSYVDGYHFYQSAGPIAEAKAIRMVEEFADKLLAEMGLDQ